MKATLAPGQTGSVDLASPEREGTARPGSDQAVLSRMASHLQGMRYGLQEYSTGRRSADPDALERWSLLLDRYDAVLVQAALVLIVPVPGAPAESSSVRRRFVPEDRAQLEGELCSAGLELDPPLA